MSRQSSRNFLRCAATAVLLAGCAFANNHHSMNGTWQLTPERSEFHGEPAIQTGTVTINDRERNIYVSRNFDFDSASQSTSTSFTTDAVRGGTIKNKETGFKSKAKWEGDALVVVTTQGGKTITERYTLRDDRTMTLQVDRPGHQPETLYFQRQ